VVTPLKLLQALRLRYVIFSHLSFFLLSSRFPALLTANYPVSRLFFLGLPSCCRTLLLTPFSRSPTYGGCVVRRRGAASELFCSFFGIPFFAVRRYDLNGTVAIKRQRFFEGADFRMTASPPPLACTSQLFGALAFEGRAPAAS